MNQKTEVQTDKADSKAHVSFERHVGVLGAVLLGMGAMLGTGAYAAIPMAAEAVGQTGIVLAVALAGVLALFNAFSSSELAARMPVAGGGYVYGTELIHPVVGAWAGWLFLLAKGMSCASACLILGGMMQLLLPDMDARAVLGIGGGAVLMLMTLAVLSGLRRANWLNVLLVVLGGGGLVLVCGVLLSEAPERGCLVPWASFSWQEMPWAIAFVFVAYTGYGRIATLGEEAKNPARTIPIAAVCVVAACVGVYLLVGLASARHGLGETHALIDASGRFAMAGRIGLAAALGGVVLNLMLGLSRVVVAMGRDGHLPGVLAGVDKDKATPATLASMLMVGVMVAAGALWGIKMAWAFSAATVLGYYALVNLCALRLKPLAWWRKVMGVLGFLGCVVLSTQVSLYGLIGLVVVLVPACLTTWLTYKKQYLG